MSRQLLNIAYEIEVKGPAKAVLNCLSDRANEVGYCWPALSRIVKDTGISLASVKRSIKMLESDGLIKVERSKKGNGYTMLFDENTPKSYGQCDPKGVQCDPPAGVSVNPLPVQCDPKGVQCDPLIESNSNLTKNLTEREQAATPPSLTSARIDDLLKKPRPSKQKKGMQAGSMYVPPSGKEKIYEYVLENFPESGREKRFNQIIELDYVTEKSLDSWLKAQKKKDPYETHYLGSAVNYFKQNRPVVATSQYHAPDETGGW